MLGAGLDCISPEVNRNRNIGEVGANMEKGFFMKYLAGMAFNEEQVRRHRTRTRVTIQRSTQPLLNTMLR